MVMLGNFRFLLVAFVIAVLTFSASAETTQPTVRQLAVDSKSIVVGTILSSKCVYNEKGFILTKTQIKVLHSVTHPRSVGTVIEVSQLGGELDGKSFDVSEHTRFDTGATYLLFLEDPSRVLIPATLGGVHGCMRIVRGDDGVSYPVVSGYRPVTGVQGGEFHYARRATSLLNGVATLAAAEPSRAIPDVGVVGNDITTAVDINTASAMTLEQMLATIHAERGDRARTSPVLRGIQVLPVFESNGLTLCSCGYRDLMLVYEQMPTAWTAYDHNEWAMARYNEYFDVHRYSADDGTWSAPNSEDELCGWPSSAQMKEIYGPLGSWGANVLAANWGWSGDGCDNIVENDIHFNPAYSWEYDLDNVLGLAGPFLYGPAVMHEMGHSLGLETGDYCGAETYNFDRPSVMVGGSRSNVEDGRGLHRRDAKALRSIYDTQGTKENIDDMGVESWWMNGSITNGTVTPTTISVGATLTLTNLFVENMSTSSVSNVRLRVYLSKNTNITESDILLGTYNSFTTFSFDDDWRGNLTRTIPSSVESGSYYVGVIVTSNGSSYDWDDYTGNNTTYFPTPITVINAGGDVPGDDFPFHAYPAAMLATRIFVDTTGAHPDPDPPYCPGTPPMGPGIFFDIVPPEDGEMEVQRDAGATNGLVAAPDVVAVYRVNQQGPPTTLLSVGCSTDSTPLHVPVLAGTTYIVRVGGTELGDVASWYRVAINPTRPFGSVPALAIPWTAALPDHNLNMSAATMQLPCAQFTTYGKWFEYTAPVNGMLLASTCAPQTNFPNAISIHSTGPNAMPIGCGVSNASGGACINPNGAATTALVTAGQRVLVRVASISQQRGDFELDLKFLPTNDNAGGCGQMQTVTPGVYPFTTIGANADIVPTCVGTSDGERATWMKIVPSVSGKLLATTCADFGGETRDEPHVSIYKGPCNALLPIACDNHGCGSAGARAIVIAGVPYAIRISGGSGVGLNGASASGKIAILVEPFCMGDLDHDGMVLASDLAIVLNAWGETASVADLNGDEIVDGSDLAILLDAWGPCE